MSKTANSEAAKGSECISQCAHSTLRHHRKARCSSKPCSSFDATRLPYDYTPCERNGRIACGDSSGDRNKEFTLTNCHETSIDLDDNAEEDAIDGRDSVIEDWTKLDASNNHRRKIVNSGCRCHCECQCQETTVDVPKSSCNNHHYHNDHHRDCCHWHCCCEQHEDFFADANECETCRISCGKAQHKTWREQMRDENGRLHARQRYSKNHPIGVTSAACEENNEQLVRNESDNEDDDDDEEVDASNDDDNDNEEEDEDAVAVINHKDSMCILAEKYKTSGNGRAKRCAIDERNKSQDKSQTSRNVDQQRKSPREGPFASVKHVCRVTHCKDCGTARTCRDRGRRHASPLAECDRSKCPLNETRGCSSRAPCGRTF